MHSNLFVTLPLRVMTAQVEHNVKTKMVKARKVA